MRQVTVTADATGVTPPVVLDQYQNPFSVTYVTSSSGDVEVTATPPYPVENQQFVEAIFDWVAAPTTSPNGDGFIGQPFTAIRLSGGAEGDTLTVIQSGVKG